MQALPILTLREGALIAGAVVAIILFLWFLARLSHRPYLVFSQSETAQMAVVQLGRIADSINRLAESVEQRTPIEDGHDNAPSKEAHRAMGLSMFGR